MATSDTSQPVKVTSTYSIDTSASAVCAADPSGRVEACIARDARSIRRLRFGNSRHIGSLSSDCPGEREEQVRRRRPCDTPL
jgi:hypothetical protein